jgi:FkbM family methyltransferase
MMSFRNKAATVGTKRAMRQLAKDAISKVTRSAGFEIKQVKPTLEDFLRSRSVDLVLDVGANIGQFGQMLRLNGYAGDILSFEPIPEIHATLEKTAARDPRWQTRRVGVGAAPGSLSINIADKNCYSSFKSTAQDGLAFDEGSRTVRTEQVPIVRLDEIVDPARAERTFLKIDTQGFEREVLEGGSELLKSCAGVQLELPILHLYADVWSIDEAIRFMTERGFAISLLESVNLLEDGVSAVELDCVFRRVR